MHARSCSGPGVWNRVWSSLSLELSPPAPHLAGSFSSFRPKLSETNAKCSFLTIFFRAGLCYHPDCGLSSNCITFNCCLFTYYCLFSLRLNPRRVVWSLSCSLLLPSTLRVVFHNRPLSAVCKMNEKLLLTNCKVRKRSMLFKKPMKSGFWFKDFLAVHYFRTEKP